MFCGECGSSATATPKTRRRPDPRPNDTTIIEPLPPRLSVFTIPIYSGHPLYGASATGERPAPIRVPAPPATPRPAATPEPPPTHFAPPPAPVEPLAPDTAATIVPVARGGVPSGASRFVLRFSTGETVSVQGSGLLGRRPLPQPSEFFDQLVQIADTGMSVSKIHLEFGQHDGEFWVSDRFSGNGTVVRRPEETAVRCEPGRRYLVPRGSRVEIADQFFLLA